MNQNRRNILKTTIVAGVGYGLGMFTQSKLQNKQQTLPSSIINDAFSGCSDLPFYKTNPQYSVNFPTLTNSTECDVCIVGGGLTGLSTALHLANTNLKVLLIEKNTIASGASGMNGGQILNSYECDMEFLEDKFGLSVAKEFWNLSLLGIDIIKKNIEKYNINCGINMGSSIVAFNNKHYAELQEKYNTLKGNYQYNNLHSACRK